MAENIICIFIAILTLPLALVLVVFLWGAAIEIIYEISQHIRK